MCICLLSLLTRSNREITMRRARIKYSLNATNMWINLSMCRGRRRVGGPASSFRSYRCSIPPALDQYFRIMVEVLENLPGTAHNGSQRIVGDVDGQACLQPNPLVELFEQRSAAGEHDAAVEDIRRKLGGR